MEIRNIETISNELVYLTKEVSRQNVVSVGIFQVYMIQFSSVQTLSYVWLFVTPCTAARQAPLSITNSQSLFKLISIESVMPTYHLICCHPLLPPSTIPSIRVFSSESVLHIRWTTYWSFSFSISPSNECLGLISFRTDWFDLLAVQVTLNVEGLKTIIKMQRKIIAII